METHKDIPAFHARHRGEWRDWLEKNHQTEKSVWLIIYKKESYTPSIYYPEAVDEALCFGWIDSTAYKRDVNSHYRFFTRRKPKSNWSKINKDKVAVLIEQGLMQPAGMEIIEIAKENGSWWALDDVENLVIHDDLQDHFSRNKSAFENWNNFPKSAKRGILYWIYSAKTPGTRKKRILETISLAGKNIRANQYTKK